MRRTVVVVITLGVCLLACVCLPAFQGQSQSQSQAPACVAEESVVVAIKADLADTVSTIKKESLDNFEKQFHQQACMSKLSICLSSVDELVGCLDKATHDAGAGKQQIATCKAKEDTYTKLKSALQQDIAQLKAAKDPKTAKSDIEQFDFTH
jgi:hypothetical protein